MQNSLVLPRPRKNCFEKQWFIIKSLICINLPFSLVLSSAALPFIVGVKDTSQCLCKVSWSGESPTNHDKKCNYSTLTAFMKNIWCNNMEYSRNYCTWSFCNQSIVPITFLHCLVNAQITLYSERIMQVQTTVNKWFTHSVTF